MTTKQRTPLCKLPDPPPFEESDPASYEPVAATCGRCGKALTLQMWRGSYGLLSKETFRKMAVCDQCADVGTLQNKVGANLGLAVAKVAQERARGRDLSPAVIAACTDAIATLATRWVEGLCHIYRVPVRSAEEIIRGILGEPDRWQTWMALARGAIAREAANNRQLV